MKIKKRAVLKKKKSLKMTEENSENGDETDEQSDAEENIYPSKLSDSEK